MDKVIKRGFYKPPVSTTEELGFDTSMCQTSIEGASLPDVLPEEQLFDETFNL